jgi:chromosome segregation ATPase
MNAGKTIQYLDAQRQAIEALIGQLDEIQVAFNAQFDQFKIQHDHTLDRLTDQIAGWPDATSAELRAAINGQLPDERQRIEERRRKVREQYLPRRLQSADELLAKAQGELAELRGLNPELDEREEQQKGEIAELEAQLAELNEEIRQKSRGLGVVRHFLTITKADRERHHILGKLEAVNEALYTTRRQWERKRAEIEESQAEYQQQWQLESIAVARLQTELDQLDDKDWREDLVLRRAIRHVLDALKEPSSSSDPDLESGLQEMVELNVQTDAYHDGLASVGGMIGLLRGINSGMEAILQSIEGLKREQEMHQAYLKPLDFDLPAPVEAFHKQWSTLAEQFADEESIGAHPTEFAAAVEPLLDGPLAQTSIEAMFNHLGAMVERATAAW